MAAAASKTNKYSYPLFFETDTKTYVLLIENIDNIVCSVKLGVKTRASAANFFSVIGHDKDGKTFFNIVDEEIDSALYSVVGYDENGKTLQVTIVPSEKGAVVVVNATRTTLMKSPPFLGKATTERIEIQHTSIIGLSVLVSGVPSSSEDCVLNGKRGKVCGLPTQIKTDTSVHKHGVPIEFNVPVAFLAGEISAAAEKRLVKNCYLVDISM